ncbi:Asp-tRNA(Asn)/Glu-tRNA(Gln) amidotransferase subunit GatA [Fangia hongkongensis]|uniref:Asp-tRNA(Asn)/Glu-tRNA(Gln) amidotransferase subunit GatA n=1 Tax=Fangia hongkongensis TaxID=270495 RepID=UPI0003731FC6|nr:Asp-tRNA(Asn)/Glu-tRNA(Gln) amidotransferase subunit GatA [Fangia hongkongensis]MBK2125415.1 Asp-tRNA(Asn)/Glu-tRNA(Gln) amidotransferase subunit GatA [Fangia hongkongensis]
MSLLKSLRKKLDSKEISSLELTKHYLNNIQKLNPTINSVISVCEDKAIEEAIAADKLISQNKQQFLTGIPIIHKDNFCTKNILTSSGSKILSNFKPPYSATIVQKLEQSGMITLAKANMDEFGMGSTNENSYYGAVKNPYDLEYVSGGSSGGSAASVAANMTPVATGSDTGGSVRQPASFCGLTGIKPSYGSVSRFGLIAYGSSFDQAGVISRSVSDCAYVLDEMSGIDDKDGTSIATDKHFFSALLETPCSFNIGFDPNLLKGLSSEAEKLMLETLDTFKSKGHTIKEITLPDLEPAVSIYYILAPAEAATNLSRFDGVRFGYRSKNANTLGDLYINTRTEGFGKEVKRRIVIGNYVLAASQYDAYYHKAQQIRQKFHQSFQQIYQDVDMILMPTSATSAFKLNAQKDPVATYLSDMYTVLANVTGSPAISFPVGQLNNMPFGAQLMGNYLEDANLINAVHYFQQDTTHHLHQAKYQGESL